MGACRGLSLLVGASAFGWEGLTTPAPVVGAALLAIYVASVTDIARRETTGTRVGPNAYLPAVILAFPFVVSGLVLCHRFIPLNPIGYLLFLPTFGWSIYCGRRLQGRPTPARIQQTIGLFIAGLLPLQAMLIAVVSEIPSVGSALAAVLLLLWPMFILLARRFYSS